MEFHNRQFNDSFLEKRLLFFEERMHVDDSGGASEEPEYSSRIQNLENADREVDSLDSIDRRLEALQTELVDDLGLGTLRDLSQDQAVTALGDLGDELGTEWAFHKLGGVDVIKVTLLLQRALAGTPCDCGVIDGLYGGATKRGLIKLQTHQECQFKDGIPGPETVQATIDYIGGGGGEALVEADEKPADGAETEKDAFAEAWERLGVNEVDNGVNWDGITFLGSFIRSGATHWKKGTYKDYALWMGVDKEAPHKSHLVLTEKNGGERLKSYDISNARQRTIGEHIQELRRIVDVRTGIADRFSTLGAENMSDTVTVAGLEFRDDSRVGWLKDGSGTYWKAAAYKNNVIWIGVRDRVPYGFTVARSNKESGTILRNEMGEAGQEMMELRIGSIKDDIDQDPIGSKERPVT